jgi:hypothetical protein
VSTAIPHPPAVATQAASRTPGRRKFLELPRRDFLTGGIAGLVAGKALEWAQPLEWTELRGMPKGTKLTFAQFGEDAILAGLFRGFHIEKPSYLDIGAYEPILSNNTYMFYRAVGGGGVFSWSRTRHSPRSLSPRGPATPYSWRGSAPMMWPKPITTS